MQVGQVDLPVDRGPVPAGQEHADRLLAERFDDQARHREGGPRTPTPRRPSSSIERIVVRVDPVTAQHCGHVRPRPTDMTSAQFSTHVAVALALLTGSTDLDRYESLQAGRWDDPGFIRLARGVRVEVGAAGRRRSAPHPRHCAPARPRVCDTFGDRCRTGLAEGAFDLGRGAGQGARPGRPELGPGCG
ncbi:hypothetical protein ACFQH9_11960 [Pseudonocardia lutea]|uniref:MmgE/PrpD C-terminal domain-containing protein n=1 Tax=Pseudonocardia lutea TaxID=2172015 RepID=A0ABW1I9C4_9PSEU